jgi:hypothetical protein
METVGDAMFVERRTPSLEDFVTEFESANSILHLEEFLGRKRFEALH